MASKSKSRRRVLRASCLLAALIVAGSSFAWFTSKDEVTNRLTATADYGVSIAEDFTPPENWLPGQKVEKNVGVVNTGNVDAIVRTWLEGEMNLLSEKRDQAKWDSTSDKFTDDLVNTAKYDSSVADTISGLKDTSDQKLRDLGLTYYKGDVAGRVYYKELSTEIHQNPNSPTNTPSNPADFNEVMTVQAGGVLAYLETGATTGENVFIYTPNQGMTIKTDDTAATHESGKTYTLVGGTKYTVKIDGSTTVFNATNGNTNDTIYVSGTDITVKDEAAIIKYLGNYIDSDNFYPAATGLYIFRRNADKDKNTNNPTISDYEFSGYYYVKTKSGTETGYVTDAATTFGNQGKYFALQNVLSEDDATRSDYVLEKDTYTVVRTADGGVAFYPTCKTTTAGTKYYQIGTDYYDADGFKLDNTTAAAAALGGTDVSDKSVTLFTAEQKVFEYADLNWKYFDKNQKYTPYTKASSKTYYVYDDKVYDSVADIKKGVETADESAPSTVIDKTWLENNANGYAAQAAAEINGSAVDMIYAIKDDVIIDIELANIGSTAEEWTILSNTTGSPINKYTFYYNNDVEEGNTTARLVDSVTLDNSITQDDYIAFDFDLNVKMESVQVTIDDDGKETAATAKTEFQSGAPVNISATGVTVDNDGSEIRSLTWSNT